MFDPGVLIVGGGQAAASCVQTLRQRGYDGTISLLGEELFVPYQRPPLSKAYLAGALDALRLFLHPPHAYEDWGVHLHLGARAVSLDLDRRRVEDHTGNVHPYRHLVIATGTRPRLPGIPGESLVNVHTLRSIGDADGLRPVLKPGQKLVILGGGYIGLEVAAIARKTGAQVTVLEREGRILARVASPELSAFFHALHTDHGVSIRTAAEAKAIEGDVTVSHVVTGNGERLRADHVLIGVGAVANTEWAGKSGITDTLGFSVDAHTRTGADRVYAVGDVSMHPSALFDMRLRLESVHNAIEQGKTAALSILGTPKAYDQAPWFWSDQYDRKLQSVGLPQFGDEVLQRGDPATGSFALFHLAGDRLMACEAVNMPDAYMAARMIMDQRRVPNRMALTDPSLRGKALMG